MHTEYDTQTVTNTLALYPRPRTNGYYIRRGIARMAAGIALMLTIVLVPHAIAYAVVPHHTDDDMRASLRTACATEDSTNCYWDATLHGNGEGRSFIDIDGTLYFQD